METPYRNMTLVPPRAPRPWRRYAMLALAVGALGAGVWVWRWWHQPPWAMRLLPPSARVLDECEWSDGILPDFAWCMRARLPRRDLPAYVRALGFSNPHATPLGTGCLCDLLGGRRTFLEVPASAAGVTSWRRVEGRVTYALTDDGRDVYVSIYRE